jgi:polyhydroxyalkanoate synthesis regulator phasin
MTELKDRLFKLLQDPRVAKLMQDPKVQQTVIKGLRFRGRVEGEMERRVQQIAKVLNLATQRDLRSLQRRIRHLEQELREAQERIIEAEDVREAQARS